MPRVNATLNRDYDAAVAAAYATGAYNSYRAIAAHFGLHLATVGRIVRARMPQGETRPRVVTLHSIDDPPELPVRTPSIASDFRLVFRHFRHRVLSHAPNRHGANVPPRKDHRSARIRGFTH